MELKVKEFSLFLQYKTFVVSFPEGEGFHTFVGRPRLVGQFVVGKVERCSLGGAEERAAVQSDGGAVLEGDFISNAVAQPLTVENEFCGGGGRIVVKIDSFRPVAGDFFRFQPSACRGGVPKRESFLVLCCQSPFAQTVVCRFQRDAEVSVLHSCHVLPVFCRGDANRSVLGAGDAPHSCDVGVGQFLFRFLLHPRADEFVGSSLDHVCQEHETSVVECAGDEIDSIVGHLSHFCDAPKHVSSLLFGLERREDHKKCEKEKENPGHNSQRKEDSVSLVFFLQVGDFD